MKPSSFVFLSRLGALVVLALPASPLPMRAGVLPARSPRGPLVAAAANPVKPFEPLTPAKPELPRTGVNLPRPPGGWLNVAVVGHQFVVRFFDAQKKPMPPDVTHGLVRFFYVTRKQIHRPLPLNRSEDSFSLVSPNRVLPPHVFRVQLVLLREGPAGSPEAHHFNYP